MAEHQANPVSPPRLQISRPVLVGLLVFPLALSVQIGTSISDFYFRTQDRWLFIVLMLALLMLSYRIPRWPVPGFKLSWARLLPILATLVLLLWWGTYALMGDYPLTRDEHMVLFDMAVFAKGHLLEPLAAEWRSNPKALVPDFLMDVPGTVALVSGYLPGNAMLRLGFSWFADPALMNPLLMGIGAIALYDIARRLFGDDRRTVLVVMVLYLGSAQVLVNAMTVYAMTGHTALSLVWLALFLRGGWAGHAGAMVVGLVAMGLHQVVFHPLFAAPFLLWLLAQRRYRLFAAYAVVIGGGALFWMVYPALAIQSMGIVAAGGAGDGVSFLRDRVWPLLVERDPMTVRLMTLNLVRFTVWQHLALLPLVAMAWPLVRRNRGIAAPLAGGIVLTLLFCTLILPQQGHGWGYRYMAPLLGSFALLGGLGYQRWRALDWRVADGVFMVLSALSAVFMVLTMWGAHRFVMPHVRLDALIAAQQADMVLVDTELPRQAVDQVRNLPDLSNRPLRLSSSALDAAALARLCERGSIALITRADMQQQGFGLNVPIASPWFESKVRQSLAGKPCLAPN